MDPRFQRLLHDSLKVSAAAHPDKPALVIEGQSFSYAQLLDAVRRLAGALERFEVQRGDRIAIYLDNSWTMVVSIFATLEIGGVFLVINPQTKADKLQYILTDSGARILITQDPLSAVWGPAAEGSPALARILSSGGGPRNSPGIVHSFEDVIREHPPASRASGVIPLDLAALIYTSGSTGHPKGVMMTHQSMAFTAGSLVEYLRLSSDDRILNFLPMAFDYGLYQLFLCVRAGATLVLERSFAYPAQILARMQSERVTVFPGVPTAYMTLIGMHARSRLNFPEVRRVTNTAAALPPEIVPRLREMFPNALLFRMYGLTECKRVCYLEPELLDEKPESVGKAIPGTEVYLLSESGGAVGPGESGILHVRGPHVMQGYWNKPELSADMLKPGRYPGERVLCTHDWFSMDAEGYLYFLGRTDDIIKCRGEKVSPIEVENCLHGIPGIREAAVVGVPDALLGEAVRAFVALEGGCSLTEKEIKGICQANLENFMVPQEILFLPELPKTPSGKIRKKDLKAPRDGRPSSS